MESEAKHTPTKSGKKTLLAIDDAFEIRDIIQRALSESYHVMVCEDCVEAVAILRPDPPGSHASENERHGFSQDDQGSVSSPSNCGYLGKG